jgi:CRISPR-associated protein Csb1
MSGTLSDHLASAFEEMRPYTGVVLTTTYHPAGGADSRVMPPTFPVGPYLFEERWVDGEHRRVVVLDQVPSQANRVEEAMRAARDSGRIRLPLFELMAETTRGQIRLTSLDFPHRYADAYLRDSQVDGTRFDASEVGKRIRSVDQGDARALFELDPGSLIFGAWDSHRKGKWPKFARAYSSFLYGLDPVAGGRKGGRMDPLNLTGAVDDAAKEEGDWKYIAEGEKAKGQRLSEIGHGNIAPNDVHGGIGITEARRAAWISFAALERIRFGPAPVEATALARAVLAALALVGDRLAFDRPSIWLRSGCDLTRASETVAFERDGGEQEALEATTDEVIETFHELRDRAAAAGLTMSGDTIRLTPTKSLAEAIEFSVSRAGGGD